MSGNDERDLPAFWPRWASITATFAVLAIAIVVVAWATHHLKMPFRGYTPVGFLLGAAALLSTAVVLAYSGRKRVGQEMIGGTMSTWLAVHIVMSALCIGLVLLHAGVRLDGFRSGTITLVLFLLVLSTGAFGLYQYVKVPRRDRSLAPGEIFRRRREIDAECQHLKAEIASALASQAVDQPDLRGVRLRLDAKEAEITDLDNILAAREATRRKLRGWLWLHIPASFAMAIALIWHVAATWTTVFPGRVQSSSDFQSASECADCHASQYQEWLHSMHAMAMQSPVTEIQNRLVLLLERERSEQGPGVMQKDLCVRCHSPSAYISRNEVEDFSTYMFSVSEQQIGSPDVEGVTCSVCHRVAEVHACSSEAVLQGKTFRECDAPAGRPDAPEFYNTNNLMFTSGRAYHGPFGKPGADPRFDPPSIGNSYHRGVFGPTYDNAIGLNGPTKEQQSTLCASCHTVVVFDKNTGQRIVKLQDTFREWKCGGEAKGDVGCRLNSAAWQSEFSCMDCHNNANLAQVVSEFEQWKQQESRPSLSDQQAMARQLLARSLDTPAPGMVATGGDRNFERPRRYTHSFVGVDHHLEPHLLNSDRNLYPAFALAAGHGQTVDADITTKAVEKLLRLAASVRIQGFDRNTGRLEVGIATLATGHKLPAGFAFAREMWLEVAVSGSPTGNDDWRVVSGNLDENHRLRKDACLTNFQAVLYSRDQEREVVLQNEASDVLVGREANKAGFTDRVEPIFPEDAPRTETLELSRCSGVSLGEVRRVRARLRFRSLPPEFLDGLAAKARVAGFQGDVERLERMKRELLIFDMAEDTIRVGLD